MTWYAKFRKWSGNVRSWLALWFYENKACIYHLSQSSGKQALPLLWDSIGIHWLSFLMCLRRSSSFLAVSGTWMKWASKMDPSQWFPAVVERMTSAECGLNIPVICAMSAPGNYVPYMLEDECSATERSTTTIHQKGIEKVELIHQRKFSEEKGDDWDHAATKCSHLNVTSSEVWKLTFSVNKMAGIFGQAI